jgi:RHS repeat-associated protein
VLDRTLSYDAAGNTTYDSKRTLTSDRYKSTKQPWRQRYPQSTTQNISEFIYGVDDQRIYKYNYLEFTDPQIAKEYYLRTQSGKELGYRNILTGAWTWYVMGIQREAQLVPAYSLPPAGPDPGGGTQGVTVPDPLSGLMGIDAGSMEKLDFPVDLYRVRTYNKDGKPYEEGYLFREELTGLKTAHEIIDTVTYEKPTHTLPVYFESSYLGDMSVGEVLDLRKSGSGLYIDPSAPDCLEGSTMLAATTSSELYPKGIFYLYDHLGNTRVTFQPSGTSCVNVTNYSIRYLADYYPYGKLLRSWQSSSQEKYLTTQHERDLATGLDFRNARYYDSETMRFYGVDDLSDDPNQVDKSPFVYTWGNPVNLTDPDGNVPVPLIAYAIGFAIGALADAATQIATNVSTGKDAFHDYSISSTMISGTAGIFTAGTGSIGTVGVKTGVQLSIATAESVSKQIVTDQAVHNAVINGDASLLKENAKNVATVKGFAKTTSDVAMNFVGSAASPFKLADPKVLSRQLDRAGRVFANGPSVARANALTGAKILSKANAIGEGVNSFSQAVTGNVLQNGADNVRGLSSLYIDSGLLQRQRDNTAVNMVPKLR